MKVCRFGEADSRLNPYQLAQKKHRVWVVSRRILLFRRWAHHTVQDSDGEAMREDESRTNAISRHQTRTISRPSLCTPFLDTTAHQKSRIVCVLDHSPIDGSFKREAPPNRPKRRCITVQRKESGSSMSSNCQILVKRPRKYVFAPFIDEFLAVALMAISLLHCLHESEVILRFQVRSAQIGQESRS